MAAPPDSENLAVTVRLLSGATVLEKKMRRDAKATVPLLDRMFHLHENRLIDKVSQGRRLFPRAGVTFVDLT